MRLRFVFTLIAALLHSSGAAAQIDSSKAFAVDKNGIAIEDGSDVFWFGGADGAPTHTAVNGSYYIDTSTRTLYYREGGAWIQQNASKIAFTPAGGITATNVADAIQEAKSDAAELPRYPLTLVHNGTLSNNQKVGWSNLNNDADIIIPVRSKVVEIVFANTNSDADWSLRFYDGSSTSGTLWFDWGPHSNKKNLVADCVLGDCTSPIFEAGDLLEIRFDDEGTNTNDMVLVLYLQAVE